MTREEAIEFIAQSVKSDVDMAKVADALKALEQEPFKPMVEIDLYSVIKQKYIEREVLDKIIAEIKEWYWQADKQELAKDPCVVDAMVDLFIRTIAKYRALYCNPLKINEEKESIPYLMHKELDVPISECQKAYDVAIEYLRSQGKIKG